MRPISRVAPPPAAHEPVLVLLHRPPQHSPPPSRSGFGSPERRKRSHLVLACNDSTSEKDGRYTLITCAPQDVASSAVREATIFAHHIRSHDVVGVGEELVVYDGGNAARGSGDGGVLHLSAARQAAARRAASARSGARRAVRQRVVPWSLRCGTIREKSWRK
ncbi:hypothetical protein ACP4OV_007098 [Aristida adscensionis]